MPMNNDQNPNPQQPPQQPNQPQPGQQPNQDQGGDKSDILQQIKQMGESNVPQQQSNIHCLPIIGQIEGHMQLPQKNKTTKYEHLIPQIVAVEQNPNIEGLLLMLNTVGGDVEAGLAISEMVASLTKPTVSIVLGGGHSIGIPIAVSADHSFIVETATMTVHPIRLTGLVIGAQQTFEYIDQMQERVTSFVIEHSNINQNTFEELMYAKGNLTRDIGTNVIGQDAVDNGMIDEVGGIGKGMMKLNQIMEANKSKQQQQQQQVIQ